MDVKDEVIRKIREIAERHHLLWLKYKYHVKAYAVQTD